MTAHLCNPSALTAETDRFLELGGSWSSLMSELQAQWRTGLYEVEKDGGAASGTVLTSVLHICVYSPSPTLLADCKNAHWKLLKGQDLHFIIFDSKVCFISMC